MPLTVPARSVSDVKHQPGHDKRQQRSLCLDLPFRIKATPPAPRSVRLTAGIRGARPAFEPITPLPRSSLYAMSERYTCTGGGVERAAEIGLDH